MRVNVEKVLERDQKLSELDDRAGGPSSPRRPQPTPKPTWWKPTDGHGRKLAVPERDRGLI